MIPTVAGRIYLVTAHQMIDMKEETYKIIHDIADETVGRLHWPTPRSAVP